MSGWQPISTAPDAGYQIWVRGEDRVPVIAYRVVNRAVADVFLCTGLATAPPCRPVEWQRIWDGVYPWGAFPI